MSISNKTPTLKCGSIQPQPISTWTVRGGESDQSWAATKVADLLRSLRNILLFAPAQSNPRDCCFFSTTSMMDGYSEIVMRWVVFFMIIFLYPWRRYGRRVLQNSTAWQ